MNTIARPKRLRAAGATGIVVGGLLLAGRAAAQDVAFQGRAGGVEPPAEILRILADDPTAFRFRRAWKQKAAAVRARRAAVAPSLGPGYTSVELAGQGAAMTGVMYVPVIPALYSDRAASYTPSQYWRRLFGDGYGAVSVSDLYGEMSRGVFAVSGAVLPWLDMPAAASHYEPTSTDDKYGNVAEFLRDALERADSLTDFGQFDNDGADGVPNSGDDDGYVDVAAFIYATAAKSCGRGATGIWPHRYTYSYAQYLAGARYAPYSTSDPAANGGVIRVDDYIIQSGVQCDGESLMGTGTFSHELGHALDLPDLYDTDDEDGTDSQGIGHWGLMGSGNWNRQMSPAHMSAWSKDQLGWLTVTTVRGSARWVSLPSVQRSGRAVRVDAPGSAEYFLLSNRQRTGSDRYLHQPGLLIWHIDPERIEARRRANRVNADANHKGVDLEEADGRNDLDFSYLRNRGDRGDPFPGSAAATAFTVTTHPGSHPYDGASLCTAGVRSIRAGAGSTASFFVSPSERQRVLGDPNGDHVVDRDDASEAYWYALGWRGGDSRRIGDADVDGDGDVDIRDGFLIDAFLRGHTVPVTGMGSLELVDCAPAESARPVADMAPESPKVTTGGRPGSER